MVKKKSDKLFFNGFHADPERLQGSDNAAPLFGIQFEYELFVRVPDMLIEHFALFVSIGGQAEQLDSAVLGIIGKVDEAFI
jgi:hypothetical protein